LEPTADGEGEYQAMLRTKTSGEQVRRFTQLNDAILWIATEFNAGDGFAEYGEVRHNDQVLWRRKR